MVKYAGLISNVQEGAGLVGGHYFLVHGADELCGLGHQRCIGFNPFDP